jgi:hypothetical protein
MHELPRNPSGYEVGVNRQPSGECILCLRSNGN